MKKTLANTVVQILGKMVTVAVSLVITGIMTRKLGVGTYGSLILISSIFVFLDSLADFGTKTIGVREIVQNPDKETWRELMGFRLLLAGLAYLVGTVVVWGWAGMEGIRWEAMVSMLMIFLTSIGGLGEMVWQSKLKMGTKVAVDMIYPGVFLILLLSRNKISLMWVMGAYLGAKLVSLVVEYGLVEELRESLWGKIDKKTIRKWWGMTWPMGVFLLVFATYDRLVDSMMIRHFMGVKEVAWYGLAYKIYAVMLQPAYFLVNSVFPLLSSKTENKRRIFGESLILLLGGGGAVILGTQIVAGTAIKWLAGDNFAPAAEILKILSWGCLFSYIGHLVGFSLISKNGQGELLKLSLVSLVFNVVSNIYFIPKFGMKGAAVVTVATEALNLCFMAWSLRRRIKSK